MIDILLSGCVGGSFVVVLVALAGCSGGTTSGSPAPAAEAGAAPTRTGATCEALCEDEAAGCPEAPPDFLAGCKSLCGAIPSRCAPEVEAQRLCTRAVGWRCSVPFVLPGDKGAPRPDDSPTPQLADPSKCVDEATAFGQCMRGQ